MVTVPAGRGLGVPEGRVLDRSDKVEPKACLPKIFRSIVVIILNQVKLFVHILIALLASGHHISADGNLNVLMDNICLHSDKFDVRGRLEEIPLGNVVGIYPSISGSGNIVKAQIFLTPTSKIPTGIEVFNTAKLIRKMLFEFVRAWRAFPRKSLWGIRGL